MSHTRTHCMSLLSSVAASCLVLGMATSSALAADAALDARLDQLFNSSETATYSRIAAIQIPGQPLAVFDIGFADKVLPLYYLADRSNASLDVIDVRSNTVAAQIGGFVGVRNDPTTGLASTAISGPDGVQAVGVGEVWVGDGDSTVKVVDLYSQKDRRNDLYRARWPIG